MPHRWWSSILIFFLGSADGFDNQLTMYPNTGSLMHWNRFHESRIDKIKTTWLTVWQRGGFLQGRGIWSAFWTKGWTLMRPTRPRNLIDLFDKGVDCDRQGLGNLIDQVDMTDMSNYVNGLIGVPRVSKGWYGRTCQLEGYGRLCWPKVSERWQPCFTIDVEIVMIKLDFDFVIVLLRQVMFIQIYNKTQDFLSWTHAPDCWWCLIDFPSKCPSLEGFWWRPVDMPQFGFLLCMTPVFAQCFDFFKGD